MSFLSPEILSLLWLVIGGKEGRSRIPGIFSQT